MVSKIGKPVKKRGRKDEIELGSRNKAPQVVEEEKLGTDKGVKGMTHRPFPTRKILGELSSEGKRSVSNTTGDITRVGDLKLTEERTA